VKDIGNGFREPFRDCIDREGVWIPGCAMMRTHRPSTRRSFA